MKIRIGGVPEHFNYLWQMSATKELFRSLGYYYEWIEYPGGTGAMAAALEANEIDFAIMLTEGAIASIEAKKDFVIHYPFVVSPLSWGVFTSAKNEIAELPKYNDGIFAISRYFSGSHLMANFLAKREGVSLKEINFYLSNNLAGARQALAEGKAQFFLWEKYMTMPLVYSGEFSKIDEVSAPWPAFVFVSKPEMNETAEIIKSTVKQCTQNFISFSEEDIIPQLMQAYHIEKADAESWFRSVTYYDGYHPWRDSITAAKIIMEKMGML